VKHSFALFCFFVPLFACAADGPFDTWSQYLGGADSSQYSSLKQINKTNVKQLEVVWTYPAGPGTLVFDPIVVDGVMYVLINRNSIVALDAATGKEIWSHPNTGAVGQRGLNYWASKDGSDRRLFYINDGYLTAIDARTGKTIQSFGDNGRTDLRVGLDRDVNRPLQTSNPGRVFENLIITPLPASGASYDSAPADIHAYSTVTGKLVWTFHVIPRPGEFGYDTWPPEAWKAAGGVHNWSEVTIDEKRGIAYFPLGTARYDFYGGNRNGNNLFANSLLALDARTGKRLWHFQTIHHDLWDYDLPVAPKLLTVKHNGRNMDVVAQATKFGYLYVFNRVTGEPLWPIEERPVPESDVPGEFSSPTQPFPTKPPPFARLSFTERDINPFATEAEQVKIRELLKNSRNEGLYTPPSFQGTISPPGHNGGANWGSVAVNPERGLLYVITKEHPTLDKLELPPPVKAGDTSPLSSDPEGFIRYNSPLNFMTVSTGLSSIGPPWSTLTAYDLNSGTIRWQIPNGGVFDLEKEGHSNTGARDPRGGPVVTAGGLIIAATASDHKIRVYDEDSGVVLWEKELPVGSDGVPAVYQVGGREYIAFCVAAGNGLNFNFGLRRPDPNAPTPNTYVVFALPSK
jgi:glucose dehydrogenase